MIYGWHWLVKDVADYTNCSFFEIMKTSALEVFGIVSLMQAKIEMNNIK